MARPLRIQYPGAVYHVSHRSDGRKKIFRNDEDFQHCIELLERSVWTYNVTLHSFVLMPSNFHLLVETPLGNLSEFMRHFIISYTSYFNRKYKKKGNLFRGRYKSIVIDKHEYLLKIARHIHLHPVQVRQLNKKTDDARMDHLKNYRWSSLPGYFGLEPRYKCISHDAVLALLGGDSPEAKEEYQQYILAHLDTKENFAGNIVHQCILGNDIFVRSIRNTFMEGEHQGEEIPLITTKQRYLSGIQIVETLEQIWGETAQKFLLKPGERRSITMDLLYRYGGFNNVRIGEILMLHYSSVSIYRKKLQQKRKEDKLFDAEIIKLERRLTQLHNEQA